MSEIKQVVSGPESLCHVMATRPYSPLCSSFLGNMTCFPVAIQGYEASASSPLKALIKCMLIIILADAEGRLSAALR